MENLKLFTSQLLDLCSQSTPLSVNSLWQEHLEIRKILKQIAEYQNGEDQSHQFSVNRNEAIPKFLQWCDKVGIKRNEGLEIKPIDGRGYGIITSKPCNFGETLISVPVKAMMTLESAKKSDLKRAMSSDPILQKMENVSLSMFLANEKLKGVDSVWCFYINLLPNSFPTPLYFETNELQLLKGSQCFEESLKLWRNIARQYAYFFQLMANDNSIFRETRLNLHNFTFHLYRWATATVMTRINFIPKNSPVLIPFWDMANHDPNLPMCTDFDDENNVSLMYSGKNYAAGEEICIFYGPRTNGEFFLHNGFVVVEEDSINTVTVHLGLTKNDPLFSLKQTVLNKFQLNTSQSFVLRIGDEETLKKLQLFAHVFNADEIQLKKLSAETSNEQFSCFDDLTKEKSKNFLKTRLELLIRSYANITDHSSENSKLIFNLISTEKKVLQKVLEQIQK